jgi:RNA polymerase sigma factor (sigma-70 family)
VKRVTAFETSTDVLPEVAEDNALPDWDRFLEILDALPEAQREAFSLLKIEGLTTAEAAEKVGVSVTALKVRAHRAYSALKKGVLEEGES